MDVMEIVLKERRARLAAERLLEQRNRELFAANEKLSMHARAISDRSVQESSTTRALRSEAKGLRDQQADFLRQLEGAHSAAVMAERRLRDSIDTIRDGFAVFDGDGRLAVANRAYLSLFAGHPVGPGTPFADIVRLCADKGLIVPDPETPQAWAATMLDRWQQDPIPPAVFKTHNGVWLKLIDRRARDGDIVSLALDITDQMRILTAIEAIPDGFVLFDRDMRIIMANARYAETIPGLSGMTLPGLSLPEILNLGLAAGAYPDAEGREAEWVAERLAYHAAEDGESTIATADGRFVRILNRPTPDGGRVGLRVDITEERRHEAALEAARDAAEAASRAKSAFLANMSHEIRTPMNGVIGMAEILCDSGLTEEQRLYAETIKSSGEALVAIINDILDYSKIEADRLELRPEPFDLERMLHEVAMLLQPRARTKGLDLAVDYDLFSPTRFVGDAVRLRQVLLNLAGNAVKFTDAGHVLMRVTGMAQDGGRQRLHVSVEDTGIGIAADNLALIFEEFRQVTSTQNRRFEGTGLGLAIARRLIRRMGGDIWVDSEPGRGSVFGFHITLPVADGDRTEVQPPRLRRVLVVDDQLLNRTILRRQLTACGIAVTLTRSGAEALEALEAAEAEALEAEEGGTDEEAEVIRFDAVLADHVLPDMSGTQLALALHERELRCPLVLMSATPAVVRSDPAAAHLAAILAKPVSRSDLFARLHGLSAGPAPDTPPQAPGPDLPQRPMRVLCAEDNRTNQLVLRKMVQGLAIDLRFAANGREAVDMWREHAPDLIFMDISMPEMDGREATRTIRAAELAAGTGAHVPIVALTAHAMEDDASEILSAGIDRHLTKPLRRADIIAAILAAAPPDVQPVSVAPDLLAEAAEA